MHSEDHFCLKCGCAKDSKVKVISVFGHSGEGKSHTLNNVFFSGRPVFPTSQSPEPCTLGVWSAYDPILKVICLDTEGLLGASIRNENKRIRLLIKVGIFSSDNPVSSPILPC